MSLEGFSASLRQFSAGLPEAAGTHGDMEMMVWATDAQAAAALYASYVIDCDWVGSDERLGQIRIVDFGIPPISPGVRGWDEIAVISIPFADCLPAEPADARQTSFAL